MIDVGFVIRLNLFLEGVIDVSFVIRLNLFLKE